MRATTLIPWMILFSTSCWAQDMFGTWKMNPVRSQFSDDNHHPRAVTVRIEPHEKGEVFTYDRITSNGQAETISTVLYFDGKERNYQRGECSGTKASRRLDKRTVEIVTKCDGRFWARFTLRLPPQPNELILDISEIRLSDGRRFDRHLVLEKQ